MKIYKPGELPQQNGCVMMLYGKTGVGKSVTTLQTAPQPILYIMTEPRDVKRFLIATGKPNDIDVDFTFYTNWDEMMEFVNTHKNFTRYATVVVDSISHMIAMNLSNEILEEGYESLESKSRKEIDKPLIMKSKMSMEGYGTLSTQMLRFTNDIARLSQRYGKAVILLARLDTMPKYNRQLEAAPSLKGQEYAKHFQGILDFIGLMETRVDESENVLYPPMVSFEGDNIMAKWNGAIPKGGVAGRVCNIAKILTASKASDSLSLNGSTVTKAADTNGSGI